MSGAAVLRAFLPDASQTLLLRACLWPGAEGDRALESWIAQLRDPVSTLMGNGTVRRRLAPLLVHARGQSLPAELSPRLRAADLYESRRSAAFDQAAAETLAVIEGQPGVLLSRGHLLAQTCYPSSHLRHRHDLDLVVDAAAEPALTARLDAAGYVRPAGGGQGVRLHGSGLPILWRPRALAFEAFHLDLFAGARPVRLYGREILVPADADVLAHVILHAAGSPSRRSLVWVADAWFVMAAGAVDWRRIEALLDAPYGALLASALVWLGDELKAPTPAATLALARSRLHGLTQTELELSVWAMRPAASVSELLSCGGGLAPLARWALWPTRRAMQAAGRKSDLRARLGRPILAVRRTLTKKRSKASLAGAPGFGEQQP